MTKEWLTRLLQAAAITITIAAVCQELEKPKEERQWHGKIGFVPYDFRLPTGRRLIETYWNRHSSHVLTGQLFGVGWTINFYALLQKIRIIGESCLSESDFLMPTRSIKTTLEDRPITAL